MNAITPSLAQRLAAREKPTTSVVMRQDWSHLLFLHWEVSPAEIQLTLPPGLFVDTFQSRAYLGIVPFFMKKVRPSYCPAIPGISWFQELNLRTYVYDENGNPGVWFYSLDCNKCLAVKTARSLFHLPYQHARMSSEKNGDTLHYTSTRRHDDVEQVFSYPSQVSSPQTAHPDSLEFFLLERYRLFSVAKKGQIRSGLVHHQPYQFQEALVETYSTQLFPLCGFSPPETALISALIAETVSVEIHPLTNN